MNFRPGPKQDQTHKLPQISQMKNGNPPLLPTSQKIKTIFDFYSYNIQIPYGHTSWHLRHKFNGGNGVGENFVLGRTDQKIVRQL